MGTAAGGQGSARGEAVWYLATTSSIGCGAGASNLRPRSGTFAPKNVGRVCMGGGFRSYRPGSALLRHVAHQEGVAVGEVGNGNASRQFAIMSLRVRGLVPTFPDGSQAVPERPGLKAKGWGVTRVEGGGAASKRTRNEKKNEKKRGEDSSILTLSEEYIENLHLQVKILEKQLEIEKLSKAAQPQYTEEAGREARGREEEESVRARREEEESRLARSMQISQGDSLSLSLSLSRPSSAFAASYPTAPHANPTHIAGKLRRHTPSPAGNSLLSADRIPLAPKDERVYKQQHLHGAAVGKAPANSDGFLAARPTLGVHTAKARVGDSERDSKRSLSEAPKAVDWGRGMSAKSGLLGMETAADVGEWVREVLASSTQACVRESIDEIAQAFVSNDVRGADAVALTMDDLRTELGIRSLGARKLLFRELANAAAL